MADTKVENGGPEPTDVETAPIPQTVATGSESANASVSSNSNVDAQPKAPVAIAKTRENLFLFFITLTQLVQIIPLGVGINSGLAIGESLGANKIESVWIVASYPLTQGSFVLIGGRLGAIFGHKNMLTVGGIWWTFWALAGGFSNNLIAMCIFRGLCGIGGGLMVPNIVALLGITFPPGNKRNLSFALFGAAAPIGAAGGSLIGAIIVQLTEWKWVFFLLGLLGLVIFGAAIATVQADAPQTPNAAVDIVGSYLGVGALILFNFVWNQAPIVGWDSPYEIALLIVSVLHLAGFAYWEMKVAKDPILPFNIWKAPSFGILTITLFFAFMSLGIYLWYMNIYMQTIRGDTLIQVGVQYLPITIGGFFAAFFAGWLIPRLPAQYIIGLGCLAVVIIQALLATIPANQTYWAMAFPAMFVSAFTIDLIVTSAQIIASNTVSMQHQGVAGSLVGTLLSYGMSTGLGFAGTVEVHTFEGGTNPLKGYHSAAYLGLGLATAALILSVGFIRIPKDTRQGWEENETAEEK